MSSIHLDKSRKSSIVKIKTLAHFEKELLCGLKVRNVLVNII